MGANAAKTEVSNLRIKKVSYCGEGMNQHSRIALYKAKQSTGGSSLATLASHRDKTDGGNNQMPTPAELETAVSKLQKRLAAIEPILKASKEDKKHMADCGMDEDASAAFMAKSAPERAAILKAASDEAIAKAAEQAKADELAKSQDETLSYEGQTISKSKDPSTFAIVKGLIAKTSANEAEIAKANERTEMVTLEKAATDDFGHLPGTASEKAAFLKHLKSAPEAVRKTADAILKGAEKVLGGAFERLGVDVLKSGDEGGATGADEFAKKRDEVAKANPSLTKTQVLAKARELYPDEFKKSQDIAKSKSSTSTRTAAAA